MLCESFYKIGLIGFALAMCPHNKNNNTDIIIHTGNIFKPLFELREPLNIYFYWKLAMDFVYKQYT